MATEANIRQVAREAGVSPSTASRVLSGRAPTSDDARRRVLDAARRLGYHPASTPSTITPKSSTIALLVPTLANPFYGELAEGAFTAARQLECHLVVVDTGGDLARQHGEVEALQDSGIDAFLFTNAEPGDEQLADLARRGLPMALLARDVAGLPVHSVVNDDFRGGSMATRHLIDLGHVQIVAIFEPSDFAGAPERIHGYRSAMEAAGLRRYCRVAEVERAEIDDGCDATRRLLDDSSVTAIVAHNDLIAIGALQACQQIGVGVPDDLSVVGYDGTILAAVTRPKLTTVAQPTREIGAVGFELVHQLVGASARLPRKIVLQPQLVIGETTALAQPVRRT